MGPRDLPRQIERLGVLDGISDRLGQLVNSAAGRHKSLLSGTWLGHPLHPALTDVPLGCWTGAAALDVLGGRRRAAAVGRLTGLGVLAALPAAATGLSDWADSYGGERRIGLVHALVNAAGVALFAGSLVAPRRARRLRLAGLATVTLGGYLGGHLTYAKGLGVDHQAFIGRPEGWVDVLDRASLEEAVPVAVDAGDARVLLYRRGSAISAVSDVCPHAGGPLHEGEVDADGCVTCPWHGSRFRLSDGAALRGPASAPAARYEARVRDGRVEVRSR